MAVPEMTNNTPSAGHISWDLFHIQYEGVGYEVPAGSTSDRWVWWRFNAGVPVLESGPAIPGDLIDDDLLLFGNTDGLAVRLQNANLIDGELIVDGTILAEAIATNQINSQHIITAGLDAGVIKFGVMHGDRISVGTLLGDRIIAGSIVTEHLAAGAVTTNELAAGAVTTNELAAGAVTAEKVSAEIIVANEVYSPEGYFGVIEADQIRSGVLDAEIALIGLLNVGQISIDPAIGITIPSPKGDTVLSSLGEGSRFAGAVETEDLTVDGGLTLNAENNAINGSLSLANVVVPPTQMPSATRYWPYTTPIGADTVGLTDSHDGLSWVALNLDTFAVQVFNKITGVRTEQYPENHWSSDYLCYNIHRVGTNFFMVMWKKSAGEYWLCRVNAAYGNFQALAKIVNVGSAGIPAVGVNLNNTNVLTIYTATDDKSLRVMEWTTSGVQVSSELWDSTYLGVPTFDRDGYPVSVVRGPIGKNGEDQMATVVNSSIRLWNTTTKTIQWWPGRAESLKGLCVEHGTTNKLRYLGYNTYRVYEFVRETNWPAGNVDIEYSWYDSNVAGTGKHETTPSPTRTFIDPYTWAGLRIDTAAPSYTGKDDSPDSVAIYIDGHRQPDVTPGANSFEYRSYALSGIPPKTENEFAGASAYPGQIRSVATFVDAVTPRLLMKGDGTGHWGDLTVDGLGKAVIGGDTGWLSVTAFVNLWENFGGVWAGAAYRRIGNIVHLRGLVRGPGNLGGAMFYLPVGFRPTTDLLLVSTIAQLGKNFDATGETFITTNASGTGSPGTSHSHGIAGGSYDIKTDVQFTNVGSRLDVQAADGSVRHSGGSDAWGGAGWISLFGVSFLID